MAIYISTLIAGEAESNEHTFNEARASFRVCGGGTSVGEGFQTKKRNKNNREQRIVGLG